MIYQFETDYKKGWCDYLSLPKGDEVHSILLNRTIRIYRYTPGIGYARFEKFPKVGLDVINSSDGELYSQKFVDCVIESNLSGISFFEVKLLPNSKEIKYPLYWGLVHGKISINLDAYCGSNYTVCPQTKQIIFDDFKRDYPSQPRVLKVVSPIENDFFRITNVLNTRTLFSDTALEKLLAHKLNFKHEVYR